MEVLKVAFAVLWSAGVYLWKFLAYLVVGLIWVWRETWLLRWGVCLGGLWFLSLPYQAKFLQRMPDIPTHVLWTMAASGVLCGGVASVLYVLFRFLERVLQLEFRPLSGFGNHPSSFHAPPEDVPPTRAGRPASPARQAAPKHEGSSFTGYSEASMARVEQLRNMRDQKRIHTDEELEELLQTAGVGAEV